MTASLPLPLPHSRGELSSKWKVMSWSCRFKVCLAKLPIVMTQSKVTRTGWVFPGLQSWSELHVHAHSSSAGLPLVVQTHLFMLEEQNAAFQVLPRTRDHLSINHVWTRLPYREIKDCSHSCCFRCQVFCTDICRLRNKTCNYSKPSKLFKATQKKRTDVTWGLCATSSLDKTAEPWLDMPNAPAALTMQDHCMTTLIIAFRDHIS